MRRTELIQREVITLDNGLRVGLAHGKTLDVSEALLTVGVGRFSDPQYIRGLSRLVEHTMYRGSEKYPDASGFDSFVREQGGISNSYSLPEATKFDFTVKTKHFEETLKHFADMVKKPLLRDEDFYHEIEVLESEWLHRKQDPNFKCNHVLVMHTTNAGHPMSRFGFGNKMSLDTIPKSKGINVPAMARQFYKQHYSSDIMTLTLVSSKSLDELEKYARDYFSDIPVVAGAGRHFVGSEWSSDEVWVPRRKEEELGAPGTNPTLLQPALSPDLPVKDLQNASNCYEGGRLDDQLSESGVYDFSSGDPGAQSAQCTEGTALPTSSSMAKLFNQTWGAGDGSGKLSGGVHNDECSARVSPSVDYDLLARYLVQRNLYLDVVEFRKERKRSGGAKQHKDAEEQQEGAMDLEGHSTRNPQHLRERSGETEALKGAKEQHKGAMALKDHSINKAQALKELSGEAKPLKVTEEDGTMALEEHLKRSTLEEHHKGAVALVEAAKEDHSGGAMAVEK